MARGSHEKERAVLKELACDDEVEIWYTRRARDEMANDQIEFVTVERILQRGAVVRVEQNSFEETLNVEGRDHDGNVVTVVAVALPDEMTIKIITAWRGKRKRG